MSLATKICPHCTSPAVYRQKNNTYKCTVCRKYVGGADGQPGRDPVIDPYDPAGDSSGPSKIVMPIVLLLSIAIIAFIFYEKSKGPEKKNNSSWRDPKVFRYYAFSGSKGPVIWEIFRQNKKGSKGTRYYLQIMNPLSNVVLSTTDLEDAEDMDVQDFSSHLYREYLQQGDTLFNGSEAGGLRAFDLYSGREILSNDQAAKFFSALKGQRIVKVNSRFWNSEFVITVADGDDYYYCPGRHYFLNKEQMKAHEENDTVRRGQFCFSQGKKANLYYLYRPRHYDEFINDYELEAFLKGESYYVEHLGPLKKIGDVFYPYPKQLSGSEKECVIAYSSDYSTEGALVIEKINREGKSVWKCTDPFLEQVKKKIYGDNLELDFKINSGMLTIYNSDLDDHHSIGIDLNTGKTLFTHSQSDKL